ncbi:MAG: methyltransferase domain-containing protein [Aphanocapsa sp. GSE-SYN-MK-11-07L]|jgi:ubiquinone/menaquinone biosynthesis C-methylase UbiE|nr:methyltransferase domain-containing protein [Aphanocapsa sp. GSE-SYN-MK-11-07L]
MEFTGERYIPSEKGIIRYEHLHRYLAALEFVKDKTVMDIACGEGYGSSILSEYAQSVLGVDINRECIDHAKKRYENSKLEFLVASCEKIPINAQSIDVVISFETIEHHDKHEAMIEELKRVLKPDGLIIISSPNRLVYSDQPNNHNPFHVKELYFDEFRNLLNKNFENLYFFGQKIVANSLIMPLQPLSFDLDNLGEIALYPQKQMGERISLTVDNSVYFIVVCSNKKLSNLGNLTSIYIDPKEDIYQELQATYNNLAILQTELSNIHTELKAIKQSSFGKMREIWLKLKSLLGIPTNYSLFSHNKSNIK